MNDDVTLPAGVNIIGAGLAGCEAALWLANKGVNVRLIEQKPLYFSPAHSSAGLAELVCSNSFKAQRPDSAPGLLKDEMRLLGSALLPVAGACSVAAGGALAVDRQLFSQQVTQLVQAQPRISLQRRQATDISGGPGISLLATGPLTGGALAQQIQALAGMQHLRFYDAAAPIVSAASLNMDEIFEASRYGRGTPDYLNCPFDKDGYEAFYQALLAGESAPAHAADKSELPPQADKSALPVYEGCLPIEVMARRGPQTLRYGPLRPVGLCNPRTGHRPWACVQLRRENAAATLYNLVGFQTNLRFAAQQQVFSMIPGLANAEFVRYGVMHRNTFLNSPAVLGANFSLNQHKNLFFAGQITGVEGYMESAASGLLAAHAIWAQLRGLPYVPPPHTSMCGALSAYICSPNKNFQPMGANMGLLPPLEENIKDKRQRYAALAQRALQQLRQWQGAAKSK